MSKVISKRPLGDYLRNLRRESGLSLRKAGEKIGISFMYVSELESGKKKPSLTVMQKYSNYYKVPTSKLIALKDEQILIQNKEIKDTDYRRDTILAILNSSDEDFKKIKECLKEIIGER